MNKLLKKLLRVRLLTLCCAFAIGTTGGVVAQAGHPGGGGHNMHFNPSHGVGVGRFNRVNNPYGGFGYNTLGGWGAGVGGLFGVDLNGNENQIPFYALHPPVYYSYPIARPYGDSPFAYPPGWFAAAAIDSGPQMILNPYAQPSTPSPSSPTPSTPTPPTPSNSTNPTPSSPTPKRVKPTAGHTASLVQTEAAPSVEALPSPEPIATLDLAAAAATSKVHVVVNPYVK